MQQFVLDSVQSGLANDASPLSHPIVPPAAYGPFFDRITYQKVCYCISNRFNISSLIILCKHFILKRNNLLMPSH